MVGHFLLSLTEIEEDRALTETFAPYMQNDHFVESRCLVDVALGRPAGATEAVYHPFRPGAEWAQCGTAWVGRRYDVLCNRFGAPRVNAAIRQRINTNRLWRTMLAPVVRDTSVVHTGETA